MTAAGDQILATSYSQVGNSENPPGSNLCSPYTDAWGAGAWCAMFVSWCCEATGYPLPPINGPHGFSYVPHGQVAAYQNARAVAEGDVEPGDILHFSWEPWHMEGGIAICSYGVYAGTPAGDHTGFFAGWLGDGYMRTTEGNTSQSSWDNGGAVMERTDRYTGQICCYARHAAMAGGGSTPKPPERGFLDMLTDSQQAELYNWMQATFWTTGNQMPRAGVPSLSDRVAKLEKQLESVYWMVGNQDPAAGVETISADARVARQNTQRLLDQ